MSQPSRRTPDTLADRLTLVRARADALYRAAVECCRQHDRAARLVDAGDPDLERRHLEALCNLCDGTLREIADAYEKATAHVHPVEETPWWHRANSLWHASREYVRRHAGCDRIGRRLTGPRDAQRLGAMQVEYELEASALLALRQAAEAYRHARPDLAA